MTDSDSEGTPGRVWVRWAARGLGTASAAVWLVAVLGSAIVESPDPVTYEGVALGVLVLIAVAGVAVSWFRERPGGLVLVGGGLALAAFAYVTAGHNRTFAVAVSGAPFLVTGLLFLTSSCLSRQRY